MATDVIQCQSLWMTLLIQKLVSIRKWRKAIVGKYCNSTDNTLFPTKLDSDKSNGYYPSLFHHFYNLMALDMEIVVSKTRNIRKKKLLNITTGAMISSMHSWDQRWYTPVVYSMGCIKLWNKHNLTKCNLSVKSYN